MFDDIKQQFIEYYKNLLIIQYRGKPNALAEIGAMANDLFANGLIWQLERAFDIETAVGKQLTILGKYVGVDRVINIDFIDKKYFELTDYSDTLTGDEVGFDTYSIQQDGFWYRYLNPQNQYELNDIELRFLIKLKILNNILNGTFKNIKDNIFKIFGTDIRVFDNLDMTINYFVPKNITSLINLVLELNYLPAPIGQGIFIYATDNPSDLFMFGSYTTTNFDNIMGFASYDDLTGGGMLSYADAI